jgi:hypothetical protein
MQKQRQSDTWLQHALRRTGWRPQRQVIAVGTLGVFIALILGALYLSQVATEASRGREMRNKIEQRDELERTNEELRVQIAEMKSLPRLQAEAEKLGFVSATAADIEFIKVDGYMPSYMRIDTVVVLEEDVEEPLPTYNERFGDWFSHTVSTLRQQFEGFNNQGR